MPQQVAGYSQLMMAFQPIQKLYATQRSAMFAIRERCLPSESERHGCMQCLTMQTIAVKNRRRDIRRLESSKRLKQPSRRRGQMISANEVGLGGQVSTASERRIDEAMLNSILEKDPPLESLMSDASRVRDERPGSALVTFSPKVFIPLTRLCRDKCGYCTFAIGPKPGERAFMSCEEVLQVARAGAQAGCSEALFTLGDKPELLYPQAKEELAAMGHTTTLSYLRYVAALVLRETGLLPHINAGVMSRRDIAMLREVSVSQGLMLESSSERLMLQGGAHHNCPDKWPSARLATIEAAGEEGVPFTSGILIGIGETRKERIQALLELRNLHDKYGHIQEIIIQNFRAKKGTLMESAPEPPLDELLWTVAIARLLFGPSMNIQVPPNLTLGGGNKDASWRRLIEAGINDWGGISPVTRDWVNPEAPWPHLAALADATRAAGKELVPRLAVYPEFVTSAPKWLDPRVMPAVHALADSLGYARAEAWCPGMALEPPHLSFGGGRGERKGNPPPPVEDGGSVRVRVVQVSADGVIRSTAEERGGDREAKGVSPAVASVLERAREGHSRLSEEEVTSLFETRGADFEAICRAADELRQVANGDEVSYVVNRNINYTNVCSYRCQFCAFSKGKLSENLRGKPYTLQLDEVARRAAEAWERGATEVCMQGGIHPDFTGQTYIDILQAVKSAAPNIHVHAFSPLEVFQGAATLGMGVEAFLRELKAAGLGSLPGTAAEVLDDEVRQELCPDKINTAQWLEVVETAHNIGLRSTSTIMFGHLDRPRAWARHLLHLRDLQKRTGGITEFVPLPFVHMQAPVYLKGRARKGPTMRECVLMHAVARLTLHPLITNIQASWVKMGPGGAQSLLAVGCNDMGGSLMNESITRAAGAAHGEELSPHEMERLIRSVGRTPRQRTTLYGTPDVEQAVRSFSAPELTPTR